MSNPPGMCAIVKNKNVTHILFFSFPDFLYPFPSLKEHFLVDCLDIWTLFRSKGMFSWHHDAIFSGCLLHPKASGTHSKSQLFSSFFLRILSQVSRNTFWLIVWISGPCLGPKVCLVGTMMQFFLVICCIQKHLELTQKVSFFLPSFCASFPKSQGTLFG